MSLVHLTKREVNKFGDASWQLYDADGIPITVFSEFCRSLSGLAHLSKAKYTNVAARFLDYLYEVKVLGGPPVTRKVLNDSIDYYLALLKSGDQISLSQGKEGQTWYEEGDEVREQALRAVARRLNIKPLSANSWDNTLAGLNRFLRLCSLLENEAREIALLKGGIDVSVIAAADWDYRPLLTAVDGVSAFRRDEVLHLKHSSMLGGVVRFRGDKLQRPKGLKKSRRQQAQIDVHSLDFPEEYFPALLKSATSWRDRALWTLLFANGIRRSEALNLRWCDIDFAEQVVYVLDPEFVRYGKQISIEERHRRFKGRTVSRTYLRQPYRAWFFEYLRRYRQEEYSLPLDGNDFVFQYLISPHFGRPMLEATDEALNSAFTSAVKRAQIPGPPICRDYVWTVHSLRHAFGMYMLNDFQEPGKQEPGLTEVEVQALMGHKDIEDTRKYAKIRASKLQNKLIAHDRHFIQGNAPAPCIAMTA